MRVLVVGGSGFIGLNVVDALLAAGHRVRATRRKSTATIFLRKRPVELVEASLAEPERLLAAMQGCDAVVLAGGHYPRYSTDLPASVEEGVSGVRNVCSAAMETGIAHFVLTSSVASLAPAPPDRAADEREIGGTAPDDSVYRRVKWEMEREVERFVAGGLPGVTLLPGGCLGPWDVRVGTAGFVVGVLRGLLPFWVDGTVNMVDVGDVASAHVAALHAEPGSAYCVSGHDVRVGDLLRTIAGRFGGSFPPEPLSPEEARSRADEDERRAQPKRERVAVPRELVDIITTGQPVSSTKAESELGVRFASLEQALERSHAWLVRFRYVPSGEGTGSHDEGRAHDCA